ncbi:MAG: hypothetical protein EXS09_00840 [Gemmataceae bacterium]|nr:hypothetical protein [Gemmataceae bacterium]
MQVEAGIRAGGRLKVHLSSRERFVICGLNCARDFLNLPGVVVSGHIGRNVSRVRIGGEVCYLKREHRVRWRDRWRNLLDGFGPVSISKREADVLSHLELHSLPGPTCLATGEVDGQAFVLVEEAHEAIDLRRLPQIGDKLAKELGCIVAEIHEAGIDQPDLFAKHFLINPDTGRITILDWQRASIRKEVPVRNRLRSLAAFRASCADSLLNRETWDVLLGSYATNSVLALPAEFQEQVSREAAKLGRRSSIRSQLALPGAEQELVRIHGEMVCAIPEVAQEFELPDVIASLYDPANAGRNYRFRNGREGVLRVTRYRIPVRKWLAKLCGKHWRSSELRTARILFHLERHGIPAPKLLAYGQHENSAFCMFEPLDCRSVNESDHPAVKCLLDRVHEAGCTLVGNPFGMDGRDAVVATPGSLRLNRRLSRSTMAKDHARLNAFLGASG